VTGRAGKSLAPTVRHIHGLVHPWVGWGWVGLGRDGVGQIFLVSVGCIELGGRVHDIFNAIFNAIPFLDELQTPQLNHIQRQVASIIKQETQLSLTNRATSLAVSQGHLVWYHSICYVLLCYSNFVRKLSVSF